MHGPTVQLRKNTILHVSTCTVQLREITILYGPTVQLRDNAMLYGPTVQFRDNAILYAPTVQLRDNAILYGRTVQLRDNAILYSTSTTVQLREWFYTVLYYSTAQRQCDFYGSTAHSDSDFIQYYIQYSSETMRFCTVLQYTSETMSILYSTTVQLRDNVVQFYISAHAYATDCTVHTPELQ